MSLSLACTYAREEPEVEDIATLIIGTEVPTMFPGNASDGKPKRESYNAPEVSYEIN